MDGIRYSGRRRPAVIITVTSIEPHSDPRSFLTGSTSRLALAARCWVFTLPSTTVHPKGRLASIDLLSEPRDSFTFHPRHIGVLLARVGML